MEDRAELSSRKVTASTTSAPVSPSFTPVNIVRDVMQRHQASVKSESNSAPDFSVDEVASRNSVCAYAANNGAKPLDELQKIGRIGERLCQNVEMPLRWKVQVGEIAEKARENAISPKQLGAMAAQSSQELLSYFPGPARDGATINRGLAHAISTAIRKISPHRDPSRKTDDYIWFLKNCERELADERLTWGQWVKLSKETPAKASLAEAQPVLAAAQRYEEHPQLRSDIEQYTRLLFQFAARALQRYQERKEARGLLDFVDLEQRTLALLEQPEVANVIKEEFDLLVVDEFQDTNPIQLTLFIRLAELVRHGAVWVGDAKQAIYGFRGSDPALMDAVIRTASTQRAQSLNTTYRARRNLLESSTTCLSRLSNANSSSAERT